MLQTWELHSVTVLKLMHQHKCVVHANDHRVDTQDMNGTWTQNGGAHMKITENRIVQTICVSASQFSLSQVDGGMFCSGLLTTW